MLYDSSRILSRWDRQAYCLYIRPPQYGSRYTNACRGIPEPQILQKARLTTKTITIVDGLPEILKEVKAIGRNLNQLTTLCNMGKIICPELFELKEQYSNAVVMLDEIARRCS